MTPEKDQGISRNNNTTPTNITGSLLLAAFVVFFSRHFLEGPATQRRLGAAALRRFLAEALVDGGEDCHL